MIENKTIVLGITGGIAAYKAADIASKLTQAGARVETVMTEAATRFITPLTLRNLTGRPVVTEFLCEDCNECGCICPDEAITIPLEKVTF